MADTVRLCSVLLVVYCFGVHCLTELFCKDPDTGAFHAVNKTWSSTTICGNYTCRIRRKIKDDMTVQSSNVHIVTASPTGITEYSTTQTREDDSKENNDKNSNNEEHNRTILEILKSNANNNGQDRYLSDDEIRTISEILHMVKKSDLESVVEVYNLAQDIYKELDSAPPEHKEEAFRHVLAKLKPDIEKPPKVPNNPQGSYWYDPQAYLEQRSDSQQAASENDMKKAFHPALNPYYALPYYYPISSFHRQASYVNPARQITPQPNVVEYYRPIPHPTCPYARREDTTLLPYPFTAVNNYNQTSPYRAYWAQQQYQPYNLEPKRTVIIHPEQNDVQEIHEHVEKRDEGKAKLNHKDFKENNYGKEKKKPKLFDADDVLPKWLIASLAKDNEEKLAPWQTAPLSDHVLDEVKANILENTEKLLNPFKKFKLEKVAKVLKLDDLTRPKREVVEIIAPVTIDDMDFEVYIEKVVCDIEIEPGLFSVGNLSAPFPYCCPKRIVDKEN